MINAIVVDDELITRMDISQMLEDAGYNVLAQCSDGFDAIELCRQYKPDVVLMDIRMPVFDGLSAAESIVKESLASSVVLLTAFDDAEFIERAKQIGVSGYLVKPIEDRILIPTVEITVAQSKRYAKALESTRDAVAKLEEKKIIDKAKLIISKRDGITEAQAYAGMQKMCMDKRVPLVDIAKLVVKSGDEKGIINQAKQMLMQRYNISENSAYKRLVAMAKQNNCSVSELARKILG